MILISVSMSLLVIIAGMFLLAKTQKENLSNVFKYVAYFVILVGFLNIFAGGTIFLAKKFMKHAVAKSQRHCEDDDDCHGKKRSKKACSRMEMGEDGGGMCEEGGGMCEEGGGMCAEGDAKMCIEKRIVMGEGCEKGCTKPCCKGKMKKDSVVILKK